LMKSEPSLNTKCFDLVAYIDLLSHQQAIDTSTHTNCFFLMSF